VPTPVIVINMDEDVDRYLRVSARLRALQLEHVRLSGCRPPAPRRDSVVATGHFGCALSHAEAVELAAREGWDEVLVVEDDCVFRDDFVVRFMELPRPDGWGIISYGARVGRIGKRVGRGLVALESGWHAHCYSVSARAYDDVARWCRRTARAQGWTMDSFAVPGLRRYLADPCLAVQEPGRSNTERRQLARHVEELPTTAARAAFAKHCAEMRTWSK
jgi:hypothetical protein